MNKAGHGQQRKLHKQLLNFILANNCNLLPQRGKLANLSLTPVAPIFPMLMRTEWSNVNEDRDKEKQTQSLAQEKLRLNYTMCLFFSLVFFFNCCKSVICYIWPSGSPASHTDLLIATEPPNNQEPELTPALFLYSHLNSSSDLCLSHTNCVEGTIFLLTSLFGVWSYFQKTSFI